MEETSKNYIALSGASKNAQKAFDAHFADEFKNVPEEQRVAWAMTAIIHCDICRQVVAFDECKVEGLARLLSISDISSKLFEAQNWYFGHGTKLLTIIAASKGINERKVKDELKKLASFYKIGNIQKYAGYRNKFGYHYDEHALSYLHNFGNEDANAFNELLLNFVKYSSDWAVITKSLIQEDKLPNKQLHRTP